MSKEFAGSLRERVIIERPVFARRTAIGVQASGLGSGRAVPGVGRARRGGGGSEAMALSAMPRFRVTIRKRDGIAIDQRSAVGRATADDPQMVDDPRLGDRHLLRCEEVRT